VGFKMESKGITLVLATAVISGVSIFLNKFAVEGSNPFVFSTMKAVLVGIFLFSLIVLLHERKRIIELTRKQWMQLAIIGLVGGSIPFLLFFYALKLTSAINAGFIHKTLFLWVFIFAAFFLREKISGKFIAGALLLLAGNFILFSNFAEFSFADGLILLATLLWAAENVISKHLLKELYGRIVAFGRMFFGSIFMLGFLAATNQLGSLFAITVEQFSWIAITSGLLFLYVLSYYTGLKYVRVSVAAAALMLAQPITAILSFVFLGTSITPEQGFGFLLIIAGAIVIIGIGYFSKAANRIGIFTAKPG